jgi:acyl-CoA thioesterase I
MTEASGKQLLIRIYGDSLSMPRAEDGIGYLETYPELILRSLLQSVPDVRVHLYNRSIPGGNVCKLYDEYHRDTAYFGGNENDIVVIQVGICDCAPRPLPPRARRWVDRSPAFLKNRIIRFLHKRRPGLLKRGLWWREVEPEVFTDVYRTWLTRSVKESTDVYVINIAPTTVNIEAHSPGLKRSIEMYNAQIREVTDSLRAPNLHLIDVYTEFSEEADRGSPCINPKDGHHLTLRGHEVYSLLILQHGMLAKHAQEENRS